MLLPQIGQTLWRSIFENKWKKKLIKRLGNNSDHCFLWKLNIYFCVVFFFVICNEMNRRNVLWDDLILIISDILFYFKSGRLRAPGF